LVLGAALYIDQFIVFAPKPSVQSANVKSIIVLDDYLSALVVEGIPPAMDVTVFKQAKTVFSKA